VALAFTIAASANFPALVLSALWKGCTSKGAVIGGFAGLISALVMTVLSKAVWNDTLGYTTAAPFPYVSAAIFSVPLAFLTIWIVSLLDNSEQARKEREAFDDQKIRSETGLGAFKGASH
jgi:cation/acetate symporter